MRTTLDIDDDVLAAAKERARREKRTAGEVVSDLLRAALTAPAASAAATVRERGPVYGFRPFPARGDMVTDAIVDALRADDVY